MAKILVTLETEGIEKIGCRIDGDIVRALLKRGRLRSSFEDREMARSYVIDEIMLALDLFLGELFDKINKETT